MNGPRIRLDRLLVARAMGSRRQVQELIRRGRVTVSGVPVSKPNAKVSAHDPISCDGDPIAPLPLLLAWHKPVGVQSTYDDPWGRVGLDGVLPPRWRTVFHPVGRLDAETSGLLLFSRYGRLTQWLLHPRRAMERAYVAVVEGAVGPEALEHLRRGVETSEGTFQAEVVSAETEHIHLVVREGRHRMVRRMLANVGHPVVTLHRLRYGPVVLGELAPEALRGLEESEALWLQRAGAPMPEF